MSITSRFAAAAIIAITAAGTMATTTRQAEAKGSGIGFGFAAGIAGAAIVGSAVAASSGYYGPGYGYRCGWVRQYDGYGNYMGRVRSCNY